MVKIFERLIQNLIIVLSELNNNQHIYNMYVMNVYIELQNGNTCKIMKTKLCEVIYFLCIH